MSPLEYYRKQMMSGDVLEDKQQLAVIEKMQVLYDLLIARYASVSTLQKVTSWFSSTKPLKGLYLWGSVGVGKTFLMNLFYHCLPFNNKLRIHFHQFMEEVHNELKQYQGRADPLALVANDLAAKYNVICFDEMMVDDIADAMLLGRLFKELIKRNICFIITSNTAPDNLYYHGLQREQFIPAIEAIKNHCEIINLEISKDYRRDFIQDAKFYWSPLTAEAKANLEKCFVEFSNHAKPSFEPLEIYGRKIEIKKQANGVVWFDFMALCSIPRSQRDYLLIVKEFHTIIVSNITVIGVQQTDLARSFIKLVDVLYDAHKRLIISAAQPADKLYPAGKLVGEFVRTRSRLIQMQSTDWVLVETKVAKDLV